MTLSKYISLLSELNNDDNTGSKTVRLSCNLYGTLYLSLFVAEFESFVGAFWDWSLVTIATIDEKSVI